MSGDLDARIAAGRATYARNFGVEPEEAERRMRERAGAAFVTEAHLAAGGPGWNGEALADRDRAVAVISALVASGVVDDRLAPYVAVARRSGLDTDALTELMILLVAYVGQPWPSAAMRLVLGSA